MKPQFKNASSVTADITPRNGGGFVAIASTGDLDRDGEVLRPGCFNPLPATLPVHLDHTMRAADLVGRGRPYYDGPNLMLDAILASTADAQVVRQKIADGVIDSMSIVFRGLEWEVIDGVRTCTRGELLGADLVSVPSNVGARILSMRSYSGATATRSARMLVDQVRADMVFVDALVALAEAKAFLAELDDEPRCKQQPEPLQSWSPLVMHHYEGEARA